MFKKKMSKMKELTSEEPVKFSAAKMEHFLSEGASFLLHRLCIRKREFFERLLQRAEQKLRALERAGMMTASGSTPAHRQLTSPVVPIVWSHVDPALASSETTVAPTSANEPSGPIGPIVGGDTTGARTATPGTVGSAGTGATAGTVGSAATAGSAAMGATAGSAGVGATAGSAAMGATTGSAGVVGNETTESVGEVVAAHGDATSAVSGASGQLQGAPGEQGAQEKPSGGETGIPVQPVEPAMDFRFVAFDQEYHLTEFSYVRLHSFS